MSSVQDIETRLIGLENMLKFIMTLFSIQDHTTPFSKPITLLEAYFIAQAHPDYKPATSAPPPPPLVEVQQ